MFLRNSLWAGLLRHVDFTLKSLTAVQGSRKRRLWDDLWAGLDVDGTPAVLRFFLFSPDARCYGAGSTRLRVRMACVPILLDVFFP